VDVRIAALESVAAAALGSAHFSLANDLHRLQGTRAVGAFEGSVFYAARILEALSAGAVRATGLDPSGNVFTNLDLLQQFNLIPPSTRYWGHALRRLGNDARHLDRQMTADDAELAALFVERWLHWFFVDFRFGPRLPRLTHDSKPLLPDGRSELSQLICQMDAPDFDSAGWTRSLLAKDSPLRTNLPSAVWAVLAEMLLARETLLALRLLDAARARFGDNSRLLQLTGLAWSRAGNLTRALEYLEPLYVRYKDDEEVIGTIAGVYKRVYQQNPSQCFDALGRSFRAYLSGWEKLRNTYLGINAAACALWLGRERESRRIAEEVRLAMRQRLERLASLAGYDAMDICYWDQATAAEAELLCGEFAEARRRYGEAFARFAADTRNIDVTRRQAQAVLAAMGLSGAEPFFSAPTKPAHASRSTLTVGISGHRTICDETTVARRLADALAVLCLLRSVGDDQPRLILESPLAEGADRLAAHVVLGMGGAVHAVMPLELSDYRRDFADASSRAQFADLLERCDRMAAPSALVTPAGSAAREAAYEAAGRAIVDQCDVMLVVWDGEHARGRGGTAEIVEYARGLGKPLAWIDSNAPFVVTYERIDAIAG
jgi:hypothetical protein